MDKTLESLVSISTVDKILVVDCDSTCRVTVASLLRYSQHGKVEVLAGPNSFNKCSAVNSAISSVTRGTVFTSDADVIWTQSSVEALIAKSRKGISFVSEVLETDRSTDVARRERFRYSCMKGQPTVVAVVVDTKQHPRPGFGLVATDIGVMQEIGGYSEELDLYGFEDQDLLLRAQLLGVNVTSSSRVTHVSHSDRIRSNTYGGLPLYVMRNRNIVRSLLAISRGQLRGSISSGRFTAPKKDLSIQLCEGFLAQLSLDEEWIRRVPGWDSLIEGL